MCRHVVDILEPDGAPTLSPAELDEYVRRCGADLDRQRASLGPAQFDAQIECVMAASNQDELVACDEVQ